MTINIENIPQGLGLVFENGCQSRFFCLLTDFFQKAGR